MKYPTPHINASPADFAKTVLMPGDPLRAKFIAETFLQDATELYCAFGVENIVRVGSAGAMQKHVHLRDIVLGQGASTTSRMAENYNLPGTFAPIASYDLLKVCEEEAKKMGIPYHVGNLLSSDVFYNDEEDLRPEETSLSRWGKMGVLAVEMEAAALYLTAARHGKKALAVCTISDHLITGEETTGEERQTSFTDMMKLALESSLRF